MADSVRRRARERSALDDRPHRSGSSSSAGLLAAVAPDRCRWCSCSFAAMRRIRAAGAVVHGRDRRDAAGVRSVSMILALPAARWSSSIARRWRRPTPRGWRAPISARPTRCAIVPRAPTSPRSWPATTSPSIRDYRPHAAGGPLHLHQSDGQPDGRLHVAARQPRSQGREPRGQLDRHDDRQDAGTARGAIDRDGSGDPDRESVRRGSTPLGHVPGTEHPLIDETGTPAHQRRDAVAAAMDGDLRRGVRSRSAARRRSSARRCCSGWPTCAPAIGGTAASAEAAATDIRRSLPAAACLYLVQSFLFQTQALLLSEWIARYPGPWDSSGISRTAGHFENLGGYELIRRRVPRIIVCATPAPTRPTSWSGLANLIRKARIDFDAEIEPFEPADYAEAPGRRAQACLGTLDQMRDRARATSARPVNVQPRCSGSVTPRLRRKDRSCFISRPTSPAMRARTFSSISATHPDFPHEPTEDQFFDEEQWESYRRLGEHIMTSLCDRDFWFWKIQL